MILLDTCVVSETLRPEPSQKVLDWLDSLSEPRVYLPAFVVGELQKGIELLPIGKKQTALKTWFEQLCERFHDRILTFDEESARQWGKLTAELEASGKTIPVIDCMIAAITLRYSGLLATRNLSHYENTGVDCIDPWS
jgi:toxin FitB